MLSLFSSDGDHRFGRVVVRGQVEAAVAFDAAAESLNVTVKQCRDLAPADTKKNRSDP
jgi:synaptotagmin-like protein